MVAKAEKTTKRTNQCFFSFLQNFRKDGFNPDRQPAKLIYGVRVVMSKMLYMNSTRVGSC